MTDDHEDPSSLLEGPDELPEGSLRALEVPAGLAHEVLRRTTAVVRRRRWWRHTRTAGLCLVVYAAGILTAALFDGPAAMPVDKSTESARPGQGAGSSAPPQSIDGALAPAALLARVPYASAAEQRRLLKLAGDTYISAYGDVEKALYCYRQLLELTPKEAKRVSEPNESWLLLALRQDQPTHTRR